MRRGLVKEIKRRESLTQEQIESIYVAIRSDVAVAARISHGHISVDEMCDIACGAVARVVGVGT